MYQCLSQAAVDKPWGAVVWTMPERVLPKYAHAFDLEDVDHAQILAEVDSFSDQVLSVAGILTYFLRPGCSSQLQWLWFP